MAFETTKATASASVSRTVLVVVVRRSQCPSFNGVLMYQCGKFFGLGLPGKSRIVVPTAVPKAGACRQ